jgi:hypothetical protein
MLADPIFSLADASPEQIVAFIGFAVFTIGFFAWVAYLVRMKYLPTQQRARRNAAGRFAGRLPWLTISCSSPRASPAAFTASGCAGALPAHWAMTRTGKGQPRCAIFSTIWDD